MTTHTTTTTTTTRTPQSEKDQNQNESQDHFLILDDINNCPPTATESYISNHSKDPTPQTTVFLYTKKRKWSDYESRQQLMSGQLDQEEGGEYEGHEDDEDVDTDTESDPDYHHHNHQKQRMPSVLPDLTNWTTITTGMDLFDIIFQTTPKKQKISNTNTPTTTPTTTTTNNLKEVQPRPQTPQLHSQMSSPPFVLPNWGLSDHNALSRRTTTLPPPPTPPPSQLKTTINYRPPPPQPLHQMNSHYVITTPIPVPTMVPSSAPFPYSYSAMITNTHQNQKASQTTFPQQSQSYEAMRDELSVRSIPPLLSGFSQPQNPPPPPSTIEISATVGSGMFTRRRSIAVTNLYSQPQPAAELREFLTTNTTSPQNTATTTPSSMWTSSNANYVTHSDHHPPTSSLLNLESQEAFLATPITLTTNPQPAPEIDIAVTTTAAIVTTPNSSLNENVITDVTSYNDDNSPSSSPSSAKMSAINIVTRLKDAFQTSGVEFTAQPFRAPISPPESYLKSTETMLGQRKGGYAKRVHEIPLTQLRYISTNAHTLKNY